MKIGEIAKASGMNASAIRYYERCGLLPAPYRTGGQRRYSSDSVYRLLLIRFASDMEFSLDEIRVFLTGLRDSTPVGSRWRKLAHRKLKEVDAKIARSQQLKSLLENLLKCNCGSVQVCVERLTLSPALAQFSADHKRERRPRVLPRRQSSRRRRSARSLVSLEPQEYAMT
jgi:DNA-binding transcriptional MerR regulator